MTSAQMAHPGPVVQVRQATKTYGPTRALTGVDIDIHPGEVLGIVGHNGAGKSTLMRVLGGIATPDSGSVTVAGATRPAADGFRGVRTAYQEGSLALELTVKENVFLSASRIMPRWNWHRAAATQALARLTEIFPEHTISPDDHVEDLPLADRQRVEIARATITDDLRVLILDEPTESLSGKAVDHLYAHIRRLRAQGVAVVLVSHRLKEILAACDRVAVMKDGAVVAVHRAAEVTEHDLFVAMGGAEEGMADRKVAATAVSAEPVAIRLPMLTVDGERSEILVRRGEVVGLAGIAGQGQDVVLDRLWRGRAGDAEIVGSRAYVPGDRQRSGIFPLWDVARNLTITALPQLSRRGLRRFAEEEALVGTWVDRLKIRGGAAAQITGLSGGNQQKVIVARAFASDAATILLDDPFRGVDIHTKIELYDLIRAEAARGRTIIWYSSENSEMKHCDRAYVLRAGRIAGVLARQDISDDRIIAMSFRQAEATPA